MSYQVCLRVNSSERNKLTLLAMLDGVTVHEIVRRAFAAGLAMDGRVREARTVMDPIQTDEEYAGLLAEAETLMGAALCTPEGERLSALVDVIGAYEDVRWPMPEPTPEERAEFRREQEGLSRLSPAGPPGSSPPPGDAARKVPGGSDASPEADPPPPSSPRPRRVRGAGRRSRGRR